jgi:DNA primase
MALTTTLTDLRCFLSNNRFWRTSEMVDQQHIDLLALVGVPLKKTANTGGGEYHGPCPRCGGEDRFVAQPQGGQNGGRCMCRQCHPQWMDAVGFVMWKEGYSFPEALETLKLDKKVSFRPRAARQFPSPDARVSDLRPDYACFSETWQQAADQFVTESCNHLWDSKTPQVLMYLRSRRLSDAIIAAADLGYNPFTRNARWGDIEVWLPRGVIIPWQLDGVYWRVRIRRLNEDLIDQKNKKYMNVIGAANGLYRADSIYPNSLVVLVESELDALTILDHAAQLRQSHSLVAVATGGTNNARVLRWVTRLALARHVFLAFDNEANSAGDKAAAYWQSVLRDKATRLKPTRHDVNDMARAGDSISEWILKGNMF